MSLFITGTLFTHSLTYSALHIKAAKVAEVSSTDIR